MNVKAKWLPICLGLALVGAVPGAAQEPDKAGKPAATPESLKAEIEALKVAKVAWREIAWKSCLLEGLKESREKKKPVLLWVFIDRPIDDARC
jgi:hypothetical protein